MLSFLKHMFGTGKPDSQVRRLLHPRDLRQGDIVKFGYLQQPDVSNQQFEIIQINTYIYGNLCYPELVLQDRNGQLVYMMVEEEDGEEYIALSKKIAKAEIDSVIDVETMERITQKGRGTHVRPLNTPQGFRPWLATDYREIDDNVKGSFLKGDARYLSEEEMKQQEEFTSYILEDTTEEYAIEIEIYSTGETEACATVYYPVHKIAEMWPLTQAVGTPQKD